MTRLHLARGRPVVWRPWAPVITRRDTKPGQPNLVHFGVKLFNSLQRRAERPKPGPTILDWWLESSPVGSTPAPAPSPPRTPRR